MLIPPVLFCFLYLVGLLSQAVTAYRAWLAGNGLVGGAMIRAPDFNPAHCLPFAFRKTGVGIAFLLLLTGGVLALLVWKSGRFARHDADPRGFSVSRQGTYETAAWMGERECRSVLKCSEIGAADGMLLGMYGNQAVSLPFQTGLNRHIAVFGASGTGKSRAVIRNALLQALKNGESVVVTDPKAELYAGLQSVTVNGEVRELHDGMLVLDADGCYTVTVQTVERTDSFQVTVDATPPTLTLSGVENGGETNGTVLMSDPSEDAELVVSKDGEAIAYRYGEPLTDAGVYHAILTDACGNQTEYRFVIIETADTSWVAFAVIAGILALGGVALVLFRRRKHR